MIEWTHLVVAVAWVEWVVQGKGRASSGAASSGKKMNDVAVLPKSMTSQPGTFFGSRLAAT